MLNTTLEFPPHMYHQYDFISPNDINEVNVNNKLFCTFSTFESLDSLVKELSLTYSILYKKMFVLHIKSKDEYAITYNIEKGNVNYIPSNTILVHRKKETNTLYTINALNDLIKKLNGGQLDKNFPIDWEHYNNCILLTQQGNLKQLNTKIFKIVEL